MKFLTILLAATLLFLAVKPGVELISLQSKSSAHCCGECSPVSNNNNKQEKDSKSCNPFQGCSCCIFLCDNSAVVNLYEPLTITKEHFTYHSVLPSKITPDFWQPPKVV